MPPPTEPTAQTIDFLTTQDLVHLVREWLYDCEYRQHAKSTLQNRRLYLDKLIWFLEQNNCARCGLPELRRFFAYLSTAHQSVEGRWGSSGRCNAAHQPVSASTVATYHRHLRAFFNWCVRDDSLGERSPTVSPMASLAPPRVQADQIQPFTQEQVWLLIEAARRTRNPLRDEVIVRMLYDTGMRAAELCHLTMRDLDLFGHRATVCGKGNKNRSVHFGSKTARALRNYLKDEQRTPDEAIFQADKNQHAGQPLTPNGLRQIIENLGKLAGLQAIRCSPHSLRHSFSIQFLRNGGNVFTLKEILGHTSLHMTNRYVSLAQADIEQQQRQCSPGDRLAG